MEEYLAIRDQVLKNSIDYKTALEKIEKLPKAWHTKHWKKMRENHLKESCENCGSSEGPLVIQHTKHPKKFADNYQQVMSRYVNFEKVKADISKKITETEVDDYLQQNSTIRESCPECGVITIRKNKTKNIFICAKQHTFEIPIKALYYTQSRTIDRDKARDSAESYLSYIAVSNEMKNLKAKYDLQVGREALLVSFEEGIEYRQFKNVKTCCKRCAAVEDKVVPAYVLCKECEERYHNPTYSTCFHCWGKSKNN